MAHLSKDITASSVHVAGPLKVSGKAKSFKAIVADTKVAKQEPNFRIPIEITKADPDQRLVFGWASVVEKDGKMIFDHQEHGIPVEEIEKAAYDFILHSRQNDDLHVGEPTGQCVESMVFTKQKQDALGIVLKDKDGVSFVGWWVGFKIHDERLWDAHKRGERPEFSIAGRALLEEVSE